MSPPDTETRVVKNSALAEPSAEPGVGDRLEFIAGYSDTTVFLHDTIYATRNGVVEAVWPLLGRGRLT